MGKKQLPRGFSSFDEIIKSNFVYVDKTELVHRLITTARRSFLSRPRRFGKSLLISTIKQIFLGNEELFKDLWIGQPGRWEWVKRPVIHIDFAELKKTTLADLEGNLGRLLDGIGQLYDADSSHCPSPEEKLAYIARTLGQHSKVVILIDEYDAPLLHHLEDASVAIEVRNFLSDFYTTLKALDEYIHLTFVTGVVKFAFSSNNLSDISYHNRYAALFDWYELQWSR